MNPVKDRRKKKDIWSCVLLTLNIIAWAFLLVILFVFHKAQPEFETFFDRFYHLKIRTFWQIEYIYMLNYVVMGGMIITLFGMVVSLRRARRQNDHHFSLVIMGSVSLILLIIAMFHV